MKIEVGANNFRSYPRTFVSNPGSGTLHNDVQKAGVGQYLCVSIGQMFVPGYLTTALCQRTRHLEAIAIEDHPGVRAPPQNRISRAIPRKYTLMIGIQQAG